MHGPFWLHVCQVTVRVNETHPQLLCVIADKHHGNCQEKENLSGDTHSHTDEETADQT